MKSAFLYCQFTAVLATFALLAQSSASAAQAPQPQHYTVHNLGPAGTAPGQPSQGQPLVIKNDGLIGGGVVSNGAAHAVLWFHGIKIDLTNSGAFGGPNSTAFSVNGIAQAVGEAETADLDPDAEDFCGTGDRHICQPFFWQGGVMSRLPGLKDGSGVAGRNAVAKGINIFGQVSGLAENTTPDSTCPAYDPASSQFQKFQFKPVIWKNGQIQQLSTSGAASGNSFTDPDGIAFKINDRGQAVGATGACAGFQLNATYLHGLHATLWQNGSVIDLGSLGAIAPGFGNFAYDINQRGEAVGASGTLDGSFHAFFWSPQTKIQDLGTIPGDGASVGLGINDNGDTTGISLPPSGLPRAFLHLNGGTMVDLNSLIPADTGLHLFSACSINSRGEIIGFAFDAQGNVYGYLATPNQAL